jgi:pSer/pThr/pTyr-binding forkhead associated (FHA) protein
MEETINNESNLGKRLNKIKKTETSAIIYKGNVIPLTAQITIGRDKANTIVLDDILVSRFHAVIQKIKSAYFIKDLNSKNGTELNGEAVPKDKYIRIYSHDVIRFGRTDFSIR